MGSTAHLPGATSVQEPYCSPVESRESSRSGSVEERGYNEGVKTLALLFCLSGLVFAQERPANLDIRFEPTAELQTGVRIPFQIVAVDDRHKPFVDATVTLQIETADHKQVQIFKAPAVALGTYVAKPEFSTPGAWNVIVTLKRGNLVGGRTIQYNVPRSAD